MPFQCEISSAAENALEQTWSYAVPVSASLWARRVCVALLDWESGFLSVPQQRLRSRWMRVFLVAAWGCVEGLAVLVLVTKPRFYSFFSFLASFTISLHKVDNVTVTIKPKPGVFPRCQIRVKTTFRSELRIKPGENVTFAFTCSTPEKYFVMEIQKNIGKMRVIFPPVNPHTFFSCCCVKVSLNNGFPCNLG